MPLPLAVATYFTLWWVVLFAVLPFGVRSPAEAGVDSPAGSDAGAPLAPRLALKALATTLISAVLFAALYAFAVYEG
jgi:predicted secreted protein